MPSSPRSTQATRPKPRELTLPLHEADLADLIELLRPEQRGVLITTLGEDFDAAALPELDEAVRDQVLEVMPSEQVAEALAAARFRRGRLCHRGPRQGRAVRHPRQAAVISSALALERSLEYPEDSAGRIMQTDLIAVPPFWSVGQTIDYMREAEDLPDRFYEIFVVDPAYHLLGSVALNQSAPLQAADHRSTPSPTATSTRFRSRPIRKRWRASSSATISPRRRWSMADGGWSA